MITGLTYFLLAFFLYCTYFYCYNLRKCLNSFLNTINTKYPTVTPDSDQLNSVNLYLLRVKQSLGFGTIELIILFFSLQILKIFITHFGEVLLFTKTHNIHQNIQQKIIDSVVNMSWISFLGTSTGKINNLVSQDTPRAASIFKMICQCINYSILFLFILLE